MTSCSCSCLWTFLLLYFWSAYWSRNRPQAQSLFRTNPRAIWKHIAKITKTFIMVVKIESQINPCSWKISSSCWCLVQNIFVQTVLTPDINNAHLKVSMLVQTLRSKLDEIKLEIENDIELKKKLHWKSIASN